MIIYIKNMACDRCIMTVRHQFFKAGIRAIEVRLGEVEVADKLSDYKISNLNKKLNSFGFEIVKEQKQQFIEQVKIHVLRLLHKERPNSNSNLSTYLSAKMHKEHSFINSLFSEVEGITIEQYFILQKIEKIKELLVYNELTISEIAYRLNYSSTKGLSNEFKKITGLSPSHFYTIREERQKILCGNVGITNTIKGNKKMEVHNEANFMSGII